MIIITKAAKKRSKKQFHHGVRIGFSAARPWVAICMLNTMMTPPRSESGSGLIWILMTGLHRTHGLTTVWSPGGLGSNPCSAIYQLPFINHWASCQPLCQPPVKIILPSPGHFEDPARQCVINSFRDALTLCSAGFASSWSLPCPRSNPVSIWSSACE